MRHRAYSGGAIAKHPGSRQRIQEEQRTLNLIAERPLAFIFSKRCSGVFLIVPSAVSMSR